MNSKKVHGSDKKYIRFAKAKRTEHNITLINTPSNNSPFTVYYIPLLPSFIIFIFLSHKKILLFYILSFSDTPFKPQKTRVSRLKILLFTFQDNNSHNNKKCFQVLENQYKSRFQGNSFYYRFLKNGNIFIFPLFQQSFY